MQKFVDKQKIFAFCKLLEKIGKNVRNFNRKSIRKEHFANFPKFYANLSQLTQLNKHFQTFHLSQHFFNLS